MTSGEPAADFRVRVLARIGAGSRLSVGESAIRSWRPVLGKLRTALSFVEGRL